MVSPVGDLFLRPGSGGGPTAGAAERDPFASSFLDFLETDRPRAIFGTFQDQFGGSDVQQRFFQNQFSNIHNQFLSSLASTAQGGQLPGSEQTFSSFLQDFPFAERFASIAPIFRGGPRRSQFAPRTRHLFF